MNKESMKKGPVFLSLMILCICCLVLSALAEDTVYVENEWGFVDQSLDISKGIPDDASGVLDRIRRTGVLRVATEPYFAPQEFIHDPFVLDFLNLKHSPQLEESTIEEALIDKLQQFLLELGKGFN